MNLGIYVPSLGPTDLNNVLFTKLNQYVDENTFDDISLFYDDINFCPIEAKFGLFNTHNLWNFTGTLFCFSLDIVPKLQNTVNKFKTVLIYDNRKNIFNILKAMENYDVMAVNEDHAKYLGRVTGKKVNILESFDFSKAAELAK